MTIFEASGPNPLMQLRAPLGVNAITAVLDKLDIWRAESGLPAALGRTSPEEDPTDA